MTYTIYEGFILQTKRALTALSNVIHKAEEHPNASSFPTSRLHDDMKSLSYQVFAATGQTNLALAKLNNTPFPEEDTESDKVYTYAQMYARLDEALQALEAVDKDFVIEHCGDVTPAPLGHQMQPLPSFAYASIMQANIFFHVTTAYGILRKDGLLLGKIDYILPFVTIH